MQTKQNINTFFCYRAIVVEEELTWEEALDYCREHHDDLASVASETEMLLIQRELKKHNTTELSWISLCFLPGDWLLVDGQEMGYEAWCEVRGTNMSTLKDEVCSHTSHRRDCMFGRLVIVKRDYSLNLLYKIHLNYLLRLV